jgi:hypothetical protein
MICSKLSFSIALSSITVCPAHAESGMAAFYSGGHRKRRGNRPNGAYGRMIGSGTAMVSVVRQ